MTFLSKMGVEQGLDGVVCSAHEIVMLRAALGPQSLLVVPGIRLASGDHHDQKRVGDARTAIADGADYLVIGRALTASPDPVGALASLGLVHA
jgi:orotidine-5'-phosphate decarboxylase